MTEEGRQSDVFKLTRVAEQIVRVKWTDGEKGRGAEEEREGFQVSFFHLVEIRFSPN